MAEAMKRFDGWLRTKGLLVGKISKWSQEIVSNNISACDGVFFAELEVMVERFRAKGDEASAHKLKALGDYMARLRFMI